MSAARPPVTWNRVTSRLLLLLCLITVLGGCINSSTTNPPVRNDTADTNPDQDNGDGDDQPPPTRDISPTTGLKVISAGGNHNCAIKNRDSSLWCWGQNNQGQLGDNSAGDASTFRQTSGEAWAQVSSGEQHNCGIKNDGTLSCWGNNASGELGNGTTGSESEPIDISTDSAWSVLASGTTHTCAINYGDNSLWCWGNNNDGQLGHTTSDNTRASEVETGTDWQLAASSDTHTCAIKLADNSLWCWGENSLAQLGDGTLVNRDSPVPVGTDYSWRSVSLANNYSCGIQTNNTLWCWGSSSSPLGYTPSDNTNTTPSRVDNTTKWTQVAISDTHACAIKDDDTLWCWGDNSHGQLGDGSTEPSAAPKKIGEETWATISLANDYSCGLKKSDLTLWCWGSNANSMLAQNSGNRTEPSAVDANTGWQTLATGDTHACIIRASDKTLWCWGSNSNGQLGFDPTGVTERAVPTQLNPDGDTEWLNVSVSGNHTCATKNERNLSNDDTPTLWCWGNNDSGQLGIGSTTQQYEPTKILFASWNSISIGSDHSCALKNDGTLWCWGNNDQHQLGHEPDNSKFPSNINETITDWRQISLGNQFSCAIRAQSDAIERLYCWGKNDVGQLGLGSTSTNEFTLGEVESISPWRAVSAGSTHACGIQEDQSLWCWGDNSYGQLASIPPAPPESPFEPSPTPIQQASKWLGVSAGNSHTCAIKLEPDPEDLEGKEEIQTLWCWGNNSVGQLGVGTTSHLATPTKIDHDKDWISVTTGSQHTCAVDAENIGYCWGMNSSGQLGNGVTIDTSRPRMFDASENWGITSDETPYPKGMIDSGALHSCALKTNPDSPTFKTLWCGGGNAYGQLGIGSTANQSAPAQIKGPNGSLEHWEFVSTGHHHTCAIQKKPVENSIPAAYTYPLYCWGKNSHNQLAADMITTIDTKLNVPYNWTPHTNIDVANKDWAKVATSASHTCAITTDNELYCWGDNSTGQIGNGGSGPGVTVTTPTQIMADMWLDVTVGGYIDDDHNEGGHTCGIKIDVAGDTQGELWCWGQNDVSQLGDETTTNAATPKQITVTNDPSSTIITPKDDAWLSVKAGNRYTCGLNLPFKSEIYLFCWGNHEQGQLGTGPVSTDSPPTNRPGIVDAGNTWHDYDPGQQSVCAINSENKLLCWGDNNAKQLTAAINADENGHEFQPATASDSGDWLAVSMGKTHGCGIREDISSGARTTYCWGDGAEYQLGDGSAWEELPQRLSLQ